MDDNDTVELGASLRDQVITVTVYTECMSVLVLME